MLAASNVAVVYFVQTGVAREAQRDIGLGVGLGSDWGRIGLDWVVFSLFFYIKG